MLELLNVVENRYSGIPTIRKEFKDDGLPALIFSVKQGKFQSFFKIQLIICEVRKWRVDMNSQSQFFWVHPFFSVLTELLSIVKGQIWIVSILVGICVFLITGLMLQGITTLIKKL